MGAEESLEGSDSRRGLVPAKRLRQESLQESFKKCRKQELDRAVADFFYANGIAFNVARNQYFQSMVQALVSANQNYVAPTSEKLRTCLLVDANHRVVSTFFHLPAQFVCLPVMFYCFCLLLICDTY
jgi:hypothetical protein